jgi:ATP-dependent DNA helicase DinG
MTIPTAAIKSESVLLPKIPAIYVSAREGYVLNEDGELKCLAHEGIRRLLHTKPALVCHAPYTCGKLGIDSMMAYDLLELFAFIHPATFAVPTPAGLAKALGISAPQSAEDYPFTLMEAAGALLSDLRQDKWQGRADPLKIAGVMAQNGLGWRWTPYVFAAFGKKFDEKEIYVGKADLNVWKNLPEWSEEAPPPPASHFPVTGEEAREKLEQVLGPGAEKRSAQMDYAGVVAGMFLPASHPPSLPSPLERGEGEEVLPLYKGGGFRWGVEDVHPNAILIEAGTGVGKTLGYLSPSSVWAEKNQGTVWISTYTKNLQRQINQELDRLYPNEDMKEAKVAVRKGRENYFCLLNFEEVAAGAALAKQANTAIAAGLMARWAAATKDGDLSGGDFPGWLPGLLGQQNTIGLADRRGECIYSACDHYHRCFVERSVRRARYARLVIANHALVMIQTADSDTDSDLPRHYVFDEGHHLFDAADSAYAGHLTARESYDLRRWLRGSEGGKKSRARGLKRRAEDLAAGDDTLQKTLQDIYDAARCLTSDGWTMRLKDGQPSGECEQFLLAVYHQVLARADGRDGPYSLETDTHPIDDNVKEAAVKLHNALERLLTPLNRLANGLRKKLNDQADTLDADTRRRIDAVVNSMALRTRNISGWIGMLESLAVSPAPPFIPPQAGGRASQNAEPRGENSTKTFFIDWMGIERIDRRAVDIGLYRHWLDPMVPFAASLRPHAHGVTVTSATLRDGTEDEGENWQVARDISGFTYLTPTIHQHQFESPFDYPERTKIFIVNDVRKDDLDQVASAYRALFEASGGGALGLFTAISRLRAVHHKIAPKLEERGLHLYAQHVDAIDNGTLVDIFRDDINACLLGTDAVRDGVDVPGDSLRLIVFDRVPWPRPTILHRARKEAFGGKKYDDRIARLKLKQAFGRLIRRADDRGVFVMLDSMLPSRLLGAFPQGVEIHKCGLAESVANIKKFLA